MRNEPLLLLAWACVSVSVMLLEMHRVWLQWFELHEHDAGRELPFAVDVFQIRLC